MLYSANLTSGDMPIAHAYLVPEDIEGGRYDGVPVNEVLVVEGVLVRSTEVRRLATITKNICWFVTYVVSSGLLYPGHWSASHRKIMSLICSGCLILTFIPSILITSYKNWEVSVAIILWGICHAIRVCYIRDERMLDNHEPVQNNMAINVDVPSVFVVVQNLQQETHNIQ